ncbi:uncharacterized protein LOC129786738 [Lutzomyia longipalpis]|uniref:uncharacterized protein LOC129786738 n=1 Tax=Lutzomyia longipalpis TaxID=7200 RepID=UPI0024842069|nr:uncharacterized protein LOC129786738 [Lutzomyia longipalpis]
MTVTVASEPIWNLERRESSGHLIWRQDGSSKAKVRFRCDVEVLEYVKDPAEHEDEDRNKKFHAVVVCATCVAALAVTVILPWFLIGSS